MFAQHHWVAGTRSSSQQPFRAAGYAVGGSPLGSMLTVAAPTLSYCARHVPDPLPPPYRRALTLTPNQHNTRQGWSCAAPDAVPDTAGPQPGLDAPLLPEALGRRSTGGQRRFVFGKVGAEFGQQEYI